LVAGQIGVLEQIADDSDVGVKGLRGASVLSDGLRRP